MIKVLDTVNLFQSNYVEIHETILNQRFGATIKYDNALAALQQAHEVLIAGREVLDEDLDNQPSTADARLVISFIDDLIAAVRKLREITGRLDQAARGEATYPFLRYRADLRQYRKLVNTYQQQGEGINSIYAGLKE